MSAKSYKKKHSTKTSIDIFFEKRPYASILLSGLLSAAGLLIIYACIGIFPFGDKSVANVDMVHQYIPFYASLKNAVFGGHGLSYSQSLGMGGSYWGLIGYYLTSPFAAAAGSAETISAYRFSHFATLCRHSCCSISVQSSGAAVLCCCL